LRASKEPPIGTDYCLSSAIASAMQNTQSWAENTPLES
jgi:hypothetical protein